MIIKIADITVHTNRRHIDTITVRLLSESIRDVGLINPITVTADYTLIAGAHRLEAFKLLGKAEIDATIIDVSGLRAELAELDENLVRNELHYTIRGEFLMRRKEIYEELHPETKQGMRNGQTSKNEIISFLDDTSAASEIISFADDTAKKTGVSTRTIEQEIQIVKNLTSEAKQAVRAVDMPKTEALKLARQDPSAQKAIADKIMSGEARNVAQAITQGKRLEVKEKLESIAAQEATTTEGVYDVIVIDPPWAMQKIEREVAPNATGFDYPTMSEAELTSLELPCAEHCHVWLWTTHKFLPMAFRLLDAWGLKYVCAFVWHKPGGFQPFGLPQYNCEFALYARKGTPEFFDTKAFNTCFEAPRGKHSEKPEAFYDVVRRVTAGRRLDMFNRRAINDFETWGNEAQ
jgi:N6-adenosine-specific RNA methylase IME4